MITLFLADDCTMLREGLRLLLETQPDFKVIGEAASGREAVRQMVQQCPNVAILREAMPGLSSIDTIAKIHKICPATQVIVLALRTTSRNIARILQAEARGYLLKTSPGSELIEAVRVVHTGQVYLCRAISDQVIDHYLDPEKAADESILLARLTLREREVFQYVVEGKSNTEIARLLDLSPGTVDTYRSRLMRKLDLHDLPSLVKLAIRLGLILLE